MNSLKDTTNMELDTSMSNSSPNENGTQKTPLKKEELEKIAKQLKNKLSKASITAKQQQQQQISPNNKITKTSPLKEYHSKKHFDTPSKLEYLSSSSPLYSPNNKSPTHMRSSAAASLLGSSPIMVESPTKRSKSTTSPLKNQSTMVLQSVTTPTPTKLKSKSLALKPSPPLSSQKSQSQNKSSSPPTTSSSGSNSQSQPQPQTTPTLPKKQLNTASSNGNPLLRTPTQGKNGNGNGNYNDEEGADLLMYLATSPSPAKSYFSNTPKLNFKSNGSSNNNDDDSTNGNEQHPNQPQSQNQNQNQNQGQPPSHNNSNTHNDNKPNTAPKIGNHSRNNSQSESQAPSSSVPFPHHKHTSSNSTANSFIAPPPPLTPKRHISSTSKTPQNRLTPSMNLFNSMTNTNTNNNASSGLPSSGLALTPAGFNMNDYVNFFSPSPGGANLSRNLNNNFLKTPDFNNLLASANQSSNQNLSTNPKQAVDGKMINFDKVGLFRNPESKD